TQVLSKPPTQRRLPRADGTDQTDIQTGVVGVQHGVIGILVLPLQHDVRLAAEIRNLLRFQQSRVVDHVDLPRVQGATSRAKYFSVVVGSTASGSVSLIF